jgi:hypothetical protein
LVVISLAALGRAAAQTPATVQYQGLLLSPAGSPLAGPVDVEIGIWDAPSGGTRLYREVHLNEPLSDGVFGLQIGAGDFAQGTFDADLFAAQNRYVEVVVDGETLAPRQPIGSVPYALRSQRAGDADSLAGIEADGYQRRVSGACPAGASIRQVDALGQVVCEPDDDSGGDVTSVVAGSGLSGGGPSGDVALAVDPGFVQRRVSGSCVVGSSIRAIAEDGSVICELDTDSGGDVTDVTAGSGLSGGGSSGNVTLSVAASGITSAHIVNGTVSGTDVADGSLTGADISSSASLVVGGVTFSSRNPGLFLPSYPTSALLTSGGNTGPEAYEVSSTCTRGEMFVARVSGDANTDSLCVCLEDQGATNLFCFNP